MANNIQTGDFAGAAVTVATTEASGVHTPHHRDPEALVLLQDVVDAIGTIPGGGGGGGDASAANQATIIAALATIAGYVDGLEGKDYATQTTLAAVLAKIIAAPATEAKQDTIIARAVAQLGARTVAQSPAVNIATDDAQIGTKVTAVTALQTGGTGLIGWLSQVWDVLQSGAVGTKVTAISALATGGAGVVGWLSQIWNELATNGIKLVSQAYDVAVSATRPANVTAYTAGDVVGATAAALTFASAGPNAGAVMITSAQLELDIAAIPSGMTSFRLHLYNVTPPSALADNAAWDLPSGDRASYLGYVDLGTPIDAGSTCYIEATNINKQLRLSGTSLFGYLVTNGGFTPANNSEVLKVTLHAVAV